MSLYTPIRPLIDQSRDASHYGDNRCARSVLRAYADTKRWTDETYRARWDGAAKLLEWWHGLDERVRPPLDHLTREDAEAFLSWLEHKTFAPSTVKGYLMGANALTKALRWASVQPVKIDDTYQPFKSVKPTPPRRPPPGAAEGAVEAVDSPLLRAKLRVLFALLTLGLTVPEACTRTWRDLVPEARRLYGYRQRFITLNVEASAALKGLAKFYSKEGPVSFRFRRILGWEPDTARRWLKRVGE